MGHIINMAEGSMAATKEVSMELIMKLARILGGEMKQLQKAFAGVQLETDLLRPEDVELVGRPSSRPAPTPAVECGVVRACACACGVCLSMCVYVYVCECCVRVLQVASRAPRMLKNATHKN